MKGNVKDFDHKNLLEILYEVETDFNKISKDFISKVNDLRDRIQEEGPIIGTIKDYYLIHALEAHMIIFIKDMAYQKQYKKVLEKMLDAIRWDKETTDTMQIFIVSYLKHIHLDFSEAIRNKKYDSLMFKKNPSFDIDYGEYEEVF